MPDLRLCDLAEARGIALSRSPVEEVIDRKLYPITETEWLQLMARQYGLPEHRPAGEQEKSR